MSDNIKNKKHILIICGTPLSLVELKIELMDHFEVNIAADEETALIVLDSYDISAVVIYIIENREKEFSVFKGILDHINKINIPIIFLAERGNDDDETTAFNLGAVDYSTRRNGTTRALISRINLRIVANEYEKRVKGNKSAPVLSTLSPDFSLRDKKILVVDDVEINREIIAGMLNNIPVLTMDFASDGEKAIEIFSKDPLSFSMILMDIQMPGMDGLEATRVVRSLGFENSREIPIIAVTAGVTENDIKRCMEAGMNNYIEKPIDYDQLISAMSKYCQ